MSNPFQSQGQLTTNEAAIMEDRQDILPLPVMNWEDTDVNNAEGHAKSRGSAQNPFGDSFRYVESVPTGDRGDYLPATPPMQW